MDPFHILLLIVAGLAGGFLAGLVGVGGGVIFSPVLFFFYTAIGVDAALVAPLTLGSSLFCTLTAALSGALGHLRSTGDIDLRIAGVVGVFGAAAVTLVTFYITTQPWYGPQAFQLVLGLVLLAAVWRMLVRGGGMLPTIRRSARQIGLPALAASGTAAGAVASSAGVGGGIVMVPMFNQVLQLPLRVATATSIATIVVISAAGVVTYTLAGLGADSPATAIGYVDFGRAIWLAAPAILGAHAGVRVAQRARVAVIRYAFAALASIVALRLIGATVGLF